MKLEDLGYDSKFENFRKEKNLEAFGVGRIISEHKERYIVKTIEKDYDAEIVGNMRFSAQSRSDFPAVGDWVAISEYDEDKVLIHAIFPRKTLIERQAVGKHGEKQIIATNIDFAFIVQAVDRDFNINRLERYLTICNTAHVKPIIILNKIDLIEENELEKMIALVEERISQIPILAISNESQKGIEELGELIIKGNTYCLLGSSGVGKSTLLNTLSGQQMMKTNAISTSNYKGRHITSHRELILLDNGGILIDNPGMREVGIADSAAGLEITFESILDYSTYCRFKNCTHIHEKGCAVLEALENEEIDMEAYDNFLKMKKEKDHFESDALERKKKDKDLGKLIKEVKKHHKKNKF